MAPPLAVSILLPAFNAAATIEACLRSVLRQRGIDWECVLIDDGSTDETLARVRQFTANDARFRILAEPHRGLVDTLRIGTEHCARPYVARMDADDWMHRDRLRLQLEALDARPALSALGCHVRIFPRAALGEGTRAYERWINSIDSPAGLRRELFVECPVAHPTLVIRRECLTELGYRDEGWPEDYDLVLRLVLSGRQVGILPRRLLGWRHSPSRLSRNDETYSVGRFTACKASFLAQSFLSGHSSYVLCGYGNTGRAMRAALADHGRHPAFVVDLHPGRLGNRIHGAPVVPPRAIPDLPRLPILVSVASEAGRRGVRETLRAFGLAETRDFVCVA